MKKFVLFALLLSYTGSQVAAEAQKIKAASRYPAIIERLMLRMALSNAVQEHARKSRLHAHCLSGEPHQLENKKYDCFFRKAQEDIGILDQDILPVKTAEEDEMKSSTIAHVDGNCIMVNSQKFDSLPYGAKRIIAIHEAFHVKYHDTTLQRYVYFRLLLLGHVLTTVSLWRKIYLSDSKKWLKTAGLLIAPVYAVGSNTALFALSQKPKGIFESLLISVGALSLIASLKHLKSSMQTFSAQAKGTKIAEFLINRSNGLLLKSAIIPIFDSLVDRSFKRFMEFRADRDAVEQSHCYKCVEEYSSIPMTDKYLIVNEKQRYIDQFSDENALCDHHGSI